MSRRDPVSPCVTPNPALFIRGLIKNLHHHTDIAPLIVWFAEDGCFTPQRKGEEHKILLRSAYRKVMTVAAELDLRMVGLRLYHPEHPSPDEFVELITVFYEDPAHQLRAEGSLEDHGPRSSRMRQLAQRCASLLMKHGRHVHAKRVAIMLDEV
ncbi:hypothetical protein PG987_013441 [Apiospora arundinis]